MELDYIYGFSGRFPGTVLTLTSTTFAYPIGSSIVLQTNDAQHIIRGHDEQITALAHAGNLLASAQLGSRIRKGCDAPVNVYSVSDRELVFQIRSLAGKVVALALSEDARFIAAAGENHLFVIYDLGTGEPVYSKHTEAAISTLTFAQIVVASGPSTANAADTRPVYKLYMTQDASVFCATLSFDIGTQSYVVSLEKFNMGSGHLSRRYTSGAAVGTSLLLGTQTGDVCVFSNGVFRAAMPLFAGKVSWLYGKDDKTVVAGGADGALKIIQGHDVLWELKHEVKVGATGIVAITHVPGIAHEYLVGTSDGAIVRASENSKTTEMVTSGVPTAVNALAVFGSTGFVLALESGDVAFWKFLPAGGAVRAAVVSGRVKVSTTAVVVLDETAGTAVAGFSDGNCRVVGCYGEQREVGSVWQAHRGAVTSVAVGETYVVTGGDDGAVRVWQRSSFSLVCQFAEHRGAVVNVIVDVKAKSLIHSIGSDHLTVTYDLKANRPVIKHKSSQSLSGLSQRVDHEQELITGTNDGRLLFWDIDYAEAVAELHTTAKVLAVKTSPTGRFVACGLVSGTAVVFDLSTGEAVEKLVTSSAGPITSVDWTSDERQVVVGSADKSVAILNFFGSN